MKKNVLIIEDNINQLRMLRKLVLETSENAVVYAEANSADAYKVLMENTIDVFLVDIILDTTKPGDTSGIKLVEKIRNIPKYMFTPVLFITSLEDPKNYAYTDLNCLGYVEKPFSVEKVKKLLQKALNYTTEKEKDITICFRRDGILYPIHVKEIVYLESLNHIVNVHLSDSTLLEVPYMTCKQVLEEDSSDVLFQCSRNTVVNKEYVLNVDVTNRYITLKDGYGRLEVGITFKKKILTEFKA
ncbi:MAG: LytTR family DNA-binding domain-containing protein [Lachnospiraceae bacterium]|nr:LytTR family DNA-binding domain-containing protein [Lachnospiraceae bacterium]